MTTRRAVLGGGAALALVPWRAGAAPPALIAALDAARAERDPATALGLLASFDGAGLAPAAQLDLLTARAGLAVDAEIVARFAIDPRAKMPVTRDPVLLALVLRRKLGDGIDLQKIAARLEVERIQCAQRATRLFAQIGIAAPTTGAGFTRLWQDTRYRYPDSDAGRDAAVADMNRSLARRGAQIPTLIGSVPGYCLNVAAVRPSPADIATEHLGVRALPTSTRPGGYIVDLTHVHDRPSWTLPSVVAHELLPGHMIQLPIEVIADPHPLRLDYAASFVEGWGIYAEQLVAKSGGYIQDPQAELGQLHWRLFRLGRALVDLGIHLNGLSVDAAQARLVEWQGQPVAFAPFASDLARIERDPMTRVAEMLAALALEDGARGLTGTALQSYHHAVLVFGRMRADEVARRGALSEQRGSSTSRW